MSRSYCHLFVYESALAHPHNLPAQCSASAVAKPNQAFRAKNFAFAELEFSKSAAYFSRKDHKLYASHH
jgi:hypothetical protein